MPHISGKKPIPRPRLRTQKHKMKEDEDFASSAGPALPPNPDLGIDERGSVISSVYLNMILFTKKKLPTISGIYVVIQSNCLLYLVKAVGVITYLLSTPKNATQCQT